jgi:hypothetical protein
MTAGRNMTMKPAIRKLWAGALLSGEYEQANNQLRETAFLPDGSTRHTYCCLGVLHDLAVKAGVESWDHDGDDVGTEPFLPAATCDWAGTGGRENPDILGGIRAAEANDELHWDFTRIAHALTGELKLTAPQIAVLKAVGYAGTPLSASGLAHVTSKPESAVRRICAALVARGLLTGDDRWEIPE